MSLNFYRGTTTTHTTLQVSQRIIDSAVTEISARNEIPIQSLLKILFRNDVSGYYTHFESGIPVHKASEGGQCVSFCFTVRDKLERLLFFDLYFWRNCYVTSVPCDNRKMLHVGN